MIKVIPQFYYSSVRLYFQCRVFSRSAFFKMAKWILSALPFFFLPKIVKFSKLYSKTALRIPISIEAFKIFCKTAFLWFYKWKSNKIYILKLGSSTKFENQVAKHPF